MSPKISNCVDNVVIKGCILNFAVKKPAIMEKITEKKIASAKATITFMNVGKATKSRTKPWFVVKIVFDITIEATIAAIPVIRPFERSVRQLR